MPITTEDDGQIVLLSLRRPPLEVIGLINRNHDTMINKGDAKIKKRLYVCIVSIYIKVSGIAVEYTAR